MEKKIQLTCFPGAGSSERSCERKLNKSTCFKKIFFSSSEKLTFEKENVNFLNTFLNFHLFYLIVVIFCKFRLYERSELQVNVCFLHEERYSPFSQILIIKYFINR